MKLVLLVILLFAGTCFAEVPTVNLPHELRQQNWVDPITGEGSCSHATTVMLLRWQLEDELAKRWRSSYSGGDYAGPEWNTHNNHAMKFEEQGIPYCYTVDADVSFIEWAIETRRGCGVTILGGRHAVLLVHLDQEKAILLDNNRPEEYIVVSRQRFLNEWANSNGWAWTPLYSPAPPLPKR